LLRQLENEEGAPMSAVTNELLEPLVEPVVRGEGLDLEDIKVAQAGRRRLVRIIVDADEGVDLDRCADVSRLLSKVFDESNVLGEDAYTLEVSSPGVSRPLTQPRHWRRAEGRLVRVVLAEGGDVTGRVVGVDDDGVVLDVDGASRDVALADVRKARVQVEFRKDGSSDDHNAEAG